MARGYYTRTVIAAWDFRNGSLTRRWTFDSNSAGSAVRGQGNHQLSVADVDADGRDEIIYGATTIDDNGTLLWTTGLGHGDALHVGDLDPARAGLEVFKVDEDDQPAGRLDGRRPHRPGHLAAPPPAAATTAAASPATSTPAAPAPSPGRRPTDGLRNATGGVSVGRKPVARPTSWPGGTATRCANCSTAPTSTSTAPAATPAC